MAIFLDELRGKIWVMENAKDYRERYEEAAARPYRQQHLFFSRNNPAISSLVAKLRLDDIDWERDQLRIPRAKRREAQVYPLLPSVGRALTDYLLSVRRSTSHREIFLTLVSPYCPLSRSGLYDMVAARLKSLNVQCAHHGPHSLRHACAARLVAQGLSLKEIGDHLGHRSTSATRVYAKVDLLGLREVAAFDLGELS